MQLTDKAKLVQMVTDVLAYYRQPVSEFVLGVWWNACQPYTLEQVSKALTAHATDPDRGQFPPKVADVVRILGGTHTDRAMLAWGKVMEAIGSVGAYQDVVFDDPAIHAVIEDLGGWSKVCRGNRDDLGYLQHRFCEAHKAYTGRGQFPYPRRLMGDRSPDAEYEKKGLALPKPAIVGDYDTAKRVYRGGETAGKTAITFTSMDVDGLALIEAAMLRLENAGGAQ
jgi:hypothetical protein